MKRLITTIWGTRIQVVCGAVSAADGADTELWVCANFGQVSIDPPRIIVNPNRVYPLEGAVRREGRFALNVFAPETRDAVLRLMRVPRRTPEKARIAGFTTLLDATHAIPYLEESMRTLFCVVENALDTGDHTVIIGRVLEDRCDAAARSRLPLMYSEIVGRPAHYPRARKAASAVLNATGAADLIRTVLAGRRGNVRPNLAANTYDLGGYTDEEIRRIATFGMTDRSRVSVPPPAMSSVTPRRRVRLCVVGVGQWGAFLATQFCRDPAVELYLCGRDAARTERVAKSVGAAGVINGLERVVADPRVEAVALVLPHSMHREAAVMALAAGKHVMVEKPIALTLADADHMQNAAVAADRILMVAENFHFRPAIRVALEAIERGDIGEPQYLRAHGGGLLRPAGWKTQIDAMGGGIIMDLGIHYVRALRLLLGEPDAVLATHGMPINTRMAGEDSAQLLFRSRFGWQAQMLLNWSGPRGAAPDLEILGTSGTLSLYSDESYIECFTAERPAYLAYAHHIRPAWLARRLTQPARFVRRIPIPDVDLAGYRAEIREFVAAIVDGRSVRGDAQDGRRDLEVVLAAYASLRKDTWVDIAPSHMSARRFL